MATGTYQGAELENAEIKVLEEIEAILKEPIPKRGSSETKIDFGFIAEKNHVKILALAKASMSKLPEKIGVLSEVEELNLSDNLLDSLPTTIGNLGKNLIRLDLWGNKLSSKSFPAEMANLYNLHFLELGGNSALKKEAKTYGAYWENSHKTKGDVRALISKFRRI